MPLIASLLTGQCLERFNSIDFITSEILLLSFKIFVDSFSAFPASATPSSYLSKYIVISGISPVSCRPILLLVDIFRFCFFLSKMIYRVFHYIYNREVSTVPIKDCLNGNNDASHDYTFRRGTSTSTIDYMFAGLELYQQLQQGDIIEFINSAWTDHALLSKIYSIKLTNNGRGIWKANPRLAANKKYVELLNSELQAYVEHKLDQSLPAQVKWDYVKNMVKKFTQRFCRSQSKWREEEIKKLQSKRNGLLRLYRNQQLYIQEIVSPIEQQLNQLQSEIVENNKLRAGKRWLGRSENSGGYILRVIKQRESRRTFNSILALMYLARIPIPNWTQ